MDKGQAFSSDKLEQLDSNMGGISTLTPMYKINSRGIKTVEYHD